uniref:BTP domain-containing protein n=1 Tax=Ascaris lumbricoides TaxID=6252 RepID=A0A0M3IDQ1_ASCLU
MTSHRVIDMVEEYAREQIRRAAARVTLNTGFARAGTRAFNVLADVMRKYLQQMWLRAKMVAEHAGRLQPNFLDASIVLNDMHISVEEMEEYMRQVGPFGPERKSVITTKRRNRTCQVWCGSLCCYFFVTFSTSCFHFPSNFLFTDSSHHFRCIWMCICVRALHASFVLVNRQEYIGEVNGHFNDEKPIAISYLL